MTTERGKRKSAGQAAAGTNGDTVADYRADLWRMADALRGSMDAADYKHVVLGLIFLKYISDAFEEAYAKLEAERDQGADPEDQDEYRAQSIFWVPPEARWQHLKIQARQPTIGRLVDDAMTAIERDNPALRDVLPKEYGRDALDKQRLGQVVDLVSNIRVGGTEAQATDVLGRVYEYFLEQFALAEGRKGGEFYTPRSVVRLLVEMLEPYQGRVYDPCCGSSSMFVQSVEFIHAHTTGNGNGGRARGDLSIYGQESNHTTWRLARMNLAIRGIEGQIAFGDSFHNDRHPDLRADYILANPPFNVSDWGGDRLREAASRGERLGLTSDELAFYDALETNDSAVQVLGDETLRLIARELVETVRSNVTIDWTLRENVRAQLRVLVRRILRKHGYPPDKQEKATRTVLEQAEALSEGWVTV